jgi:Family of unknown function (DUF6252)
MKTALVLFLSIFVLALSSCSDDDGGTDNTIDGDNGLTVGQMTCSIDGTAWNSVMSIALEVADTGTITITGTGSDLSQIFLIVNTDGSKDGEAGEAHYLVTDAQGTYSESFATDEGLTYTITKASNQLLEGTFSFTGTNPADQSTKEITNGKFYVNVANASF